MSRTTFKTAAASTGSRLRFQLTPLLDLLLIIVFAQFLEVRETADAREQFEAARFAEQTADLESRATELAKRFDRRVAELERIEAQVRAERSELQSERNAALDAADDAAQREDRAGELLAKLLDLPADLLEQVDPPPGSPVADDVAAARRRAEALRQSRGAEVLRFLVGYEELLKRAEIWTLHVDASGRVALSAGGETIDFRLERGGQDARAEEFADRLFAAYKMLPQPKGLVVILVSYGRRARAGDYQPVLDGLSEAVRRLRIDQAARTQFEFAVLGATPEPLAVAPPRVPAVTPPTPTRTESPSR